MARTKSPGADTRSRGRSREEWSCFVCTLLNNWRERRCGACDSERPADVDSQPTEWSCEVCTLVNEWSALRCVACEHERPVPTGASASPAKPEPQQPAIPAFSPSSVSTGASVEADGGPASPTRPSRKRPLSPATHPTTGATTISAHREKPWAPHCSPPSHQTKAENGAVETSSALHDVEADASTEGLPEAPTFNLLSFMTASNESPRVNEHASATTSSVYDTGVASPTFTLLGGPRIDLMDMTNEKPEPTKFEKSDNQLAKAGLQLSDSESEDEDDLATRNKRRLRRRRSLQSSPTSPVNSASTHDPISVDQAEWECPICTHNNPGHCSHCDLCNTKRDRDSTIGIKTTHQPDADLAECPVCTHLNPKYASACELCNSKAPHTGSEPTFTCIVCTNVNAGHLDQCEMCETKRKSVACPVCTTLNDANRKRCEVCESIINNQQGSTSTRNEYIDLAASQNDGHEDTLDRYRDSGYKSDSRVDRESVGDFEDEVDGHYEMYPTSPTRPKSRATDVRQNQMNRDDVEDISDHEMYGRMPPDNQEPTQSRRPELREFEHFLTVDDARLDYQCQIDYRSMFAESSRSRSYADRLQKRRRESQKRKRSAAENGPNHKQSGAGRGKSAAGKKKASKAGGKKAKAAERRASTGRAPAKSAKKPRGEPKPRRSSAPAFNGGAGGVSYYDTIGEDFGDDVTTMAWEGVGSAGYF